jgi:hypothetical protein
MREFCEHIQTACSERLLAPTLPLAVTNQEIAPRLYPTAWQIPDLSSQMDTLRGDAVHPFQYKKHPARIVPHGAWSQPDFT